MPSSRDTTASVPERSVPSARYFGHFWNMDMLWAALIACANAVAYSLLRQATQTDDNRIYMERAMHDPVLALGLHPIYIHLLHFVLRAGTYVGLTHYEAGSLFSALTGAALLSLFFLLLRRMGVSQLLSFTYSMLIGWCHPVLENTTCVELYAPLLVCIVTVLHLLLCEIRHGARRWDWPLCLACGVTVLMHAAMAMWVLALYVALCRRYRANRWRVIGYLAQGALVAAVLGVGVVLARHRSAPYEGDIIAWMRMFLVMDSFAAALGRLVRAPLTDINPFLGLAMFPGVAGIWLMWRRWRAPAQMTLLASLLFVIAFSSWIVDRGTFYMPLLPLWGIAAAVAAQQILERGSARLITWLFLLCLLNYAVFQWGVRALDVRNLSVGIQAIWVAGFWLFLWASGWSLSRNLCHMPESKRLKELPRRQATVCAMAFALALLAGQGMLCLHRTVNLSRWGEVGPLMADLFNGKPIMDIYNTMLVTAKLGPYEEFPPVGTVITRYGDLDKPAVLARLTDALRNGDADFGQGMVYFDAPSLKRFQEVWKNGIQNSENKAAFDWVNRGCRDLPQELFEFIPTDVGETRLWRAQFRDPYEAERHRRRMDPYWVEDWGGTPVAWSRPNTQVPLERRKGLLTLRYWVGHPDVSAKHPVRISTQLGGRVLADLSATTVGMVQTQVWVDLTTASRPSLLILVDPPWKSHDGRELGVGLPPVIWSDAPAGPTGP